MADPFTIRIFVPNGDPEGVRIIDRMNWTGLGIAFPRDKWLETKSRSEFDRTGVYILVGYEGKEDDELPKLYIGQSDGVRNRIDSHYQNKDFWNWGIVFVSANNGLNRAHVTWLEYALIQRAFQTKRSQLDNGNMPQEPALSESEKADTQGFLKEIMQILPIVGLQAFEFPKAVAIPKASSNDIMGLPTIVQNDTPLPVIVEKDTVIVPAQKEGFERVFLGEDCWYAIRISGGMLQKIKYIAGYQTAPVSAITHYAPIDRIEPYGEEGKYKLIFSEKAKPIGQIPFGNAPKGAMQGIRYTSFTSLQSAKKLADLL
ncbi:MULTISPECIES: GIY-YIG nuclease family protein [unclassified Tolypothrix]|uniref:GIY-YIG nuclease family protein n=1 Tax=unclassified Tolypothrix TaxID=2649714 RepID=UPI0005EAAA56|nr:MULTISPECIES: GIY-YIG nuclease family protein [unclassified Tolypothrix]EKE96409.1 hypothetical protein FDUTEX481_09755 [Tolypothrix sp. PCC 7601]MBE9084154.1 GIY-YIG nuclease family protein [Tolypothrix sp. LEGE 11397]UYD31054.1 GIY-YIG nuclease family protein [Tolypothrix sp. PCC 7712]BAY96029.1 hypothetical protein NIES3275_81060 [Microchaete diplosiphon NIES-3275]